MTKTKYIEKYNKKISGLMTVVMSTGEMSDSFRESQIDELVDTLFRLKHTYQGGGK